MVNRLPQLAFAAAPFDSGRFNLHVVPDGPARTLVVLVHGLGGTGYGTWGQLPERLFSGASVSTNVRVDVGLDVGVYDYRSGLRRLRGRTGDFGSWVTQLCHHLRNLDAEYPHIYLVGHSLGGLLVEAVAKEYVQARSLQGANGAGNLAALVLVASPRAGSGWAVPLLRPLIREIRILTRLSAHSANVETFFSTFVEKENLASASKPVILPCYAAYGANDRLVSRFSAAFSVPDPQRLPLVATHRSIVRPDSSDAQLIGWLRAVIAGRLEVLRQADRERQHAARLTPKPTVTTQALIVTRFLSDPSGMRWEQIYNEARQAATTTAVVVFDARDMPGAEIDLVIAVHRADLVLAGDQAVRAAVLHARAEQNERSSPSIAICPVGADFRTAETTVREWLGQHPPTASVYVTGAPDAAALRSVFATLLQLVIGRDPRRGVAATLSDQGLDEPSDDFDDPIRGD